MGGRTYEASFDASPARTFEAARRVVGEQGYSVLHSDQSAWVLSFNTGRSMSSWNGQDLSASFFANGSGTKVVVGGSLARASNPFGGGQAFAWGEKGRLAQQFLDRIADWLPSIPELTSSSTGADDVAGSFTAELGELVKLREAGHLSGEEFAAAKRRLIEG